MLPLEYTRQRVEAQGFLGLEDEPLAALAPWLRFTPSLNMVMVAAASAVGTAESLAAAGAMMLLGALSRAHPFDRIYNLIVCAITEGPPLPLSSHRRRGVFAFASLWLGGAAFAVHSGYPQLGVGLGWTLVAMVAPLATVHFCMMSEPVEMLFGPAERGVDAVDPHPPSD